MAASSLFNEGLTLMLYGMGFVFIFLTVLVFVTRLMSKLVTQYEQNVGVLPAGGVPSPTAVIPHHDAAAQSVKSEQDTVLAVLTAAVREHRQRPPK